MGQTELTMQKASPRVPRLVYTCAHSTCAVGQMPLAEWRKWPWVAPYAMVDARLHEVAGRMQAVGKMRASLHWNPTPSPQVPGRYFLWGCDPVPLPHLGATLPRPPSKRPMLWPSSCLERDLGLLRPSHALAPAGKD